MSQQPAVKVVSHSPFQTSQDITSLMGSVGQIIERGKARKEEIDMEVSGPWEKPLRIRPIFHLQNGKCIVSIPTFWAPQTSEAVMISNDLDPKYRPIVPICKEIKIIYSGIPCDQVHAGEKCAVSHGYQHNGLIIFGPNRFQISFGAADEAFPKKNSNLGVGINAPGIYQTFEYLVKE